MNGRRLLTLARNALRRAIARIELRLHPPEPEPLLDPDEAAHRAVEAHRAARRASRRPWYYSRPQRFEVPESLKYYEAIYGAKATLKMLAAKAERAESEGE